MLLLVVDLRDVREREAIVVVTRLAHRMSKKCPYIVTLKIVLIPMQVLFSPNLKCPL